MPEDALALKPHWRESLESLLRLYVPDCEVWAYGSRVNGTHHNGSDLDLVVRAPALAPVGEPMRALRSALQDSNIPILVQVHDWAALPESFHREIEREYLVVAEPTGMG